MHMKRFYANGGKHPTKGIGHSLESRKKMSESHKGVRPSLSDNVRQKLREHCRKILLAPEVVAKTIAINRKRIGTLSASYGKPPGHTKKFWYVPPDGKPVCLRSSWEFRFAKWLDTNGYFWRYESKAFPVEYTVTGETRSGTYIPDFVTNDIIYEVKGRWTVEGKAKFDSFVRTYPDIPIILADRAWLKERNIL